MILVAIAALSLVVLTAVGAVFNVSLPSMSNSIVSLINTALGYLNEGAGLFWSLVYPTPVKACLNLTLAAVGLYNGYKLVMWAMKKIPMFGVEE